MFSTIGIGLLLLVAVIALGVFVVRRFRFPEALLALGIALVLALVWGAFACTVQVSTRNIGVITSFGKVDGVVDNGIHLVMPWQDVTELPENIQLQAFESASFDDADKGNGKDNNPAALKVRLANNSTAYVDENLNWQLKEGNAPRLFQNYGGSNDDVFSKITSNLVDRQAQVALSEVFASFSPQGVPTLDANGNPVNTPANAVAKDLPTLAAETKTKLQAAIDANGGGIDILDVRIPGIFYDSGTQGRIDAFNQKVQETKNAQQDIQTATANASASAQRAAQPVPNLSIAIFNCINQAAQDKRDASGCWGQIGGQPLISIPAPAK
jgi:regulator of protease activity HflC (stomatin/prohibitin superfamily)